jgi:formylglycine-generating enzyme required for sulfatase activity
MRVWIASDKRWGESTETRWVVEWQTTDPKYAAMTEDERMDYDPFSHPWHFRSFGARGKGLAIAYAQRVAPATFWGVCDVHREHLEQLSGDVWNWCRDMEPHLEVGPADEPVGMTT